MFLQGEEFEGRIEEMSSRAPDRGTFKGPGGRVHDVPARYLRRERAPYSAIGVQVRRAVQEGNGIHPTWLQAVGHPHDRAAY